LGHLEQVEAQIPLTLCKMEKAFPPEFFDIMLHLSIHLIHEAKNLALVQFTWLHPIEQVMDTFKSYIRSRTGPEASISNGYFS